MLQHSRSPTRCRCADRTYTGRRAARCDPIPSVLPALHGGKNFGIWPDGADRPLLAMRTCRRWLLTPAATLEPPTLLHTTAAIVVITTIAATAELMLV